MAVAYSFMYLARIGKVPNFVTFVNFPRICVCMRVTFNRPAYVVTLLSSATGPRTKSRYKYLWTTNNLDSKLTCVTSKESDVKPGRFVHKYRFACAVPSSPTATLITHFSRFSFCLTLPYTFQFMCSVSLVFPHLTLPLLSTSLHPKD